METCIYIDIQFKIMIWEQFGLVKNPFNILPLLEGGYLPIKEAFVGREKERSYINTLLQSEDRICLTICGNVGIGKTSIANFEKFVWKYHEDEKPLFSFRREIEANETILNKNSFLLEIIGSILREIELLDPALITKHDLLMKLNQMVDITQTLGISSSVSAGMLGLGLQSDISEKQMIQPLQLSTASLEKQFMELLKFVKSHKIAKKQYQGIIIHVNNFEIAISTNKKQVLKFFSEIRDFLQTPDLYFIFLGPNGFFKDIISYDTRVRSIFNQTPIILEPLSKYELVQALNKRLELLKSPTAKNVIKPFEDKVIHELYDMFSGDVRMVMSSLKDIVTNMGDKLPKTLSMDEALFLLGRERLSHIDDKLTSEQKRILAFIVSKDSYVTQNEIALELKKSPTNVSNYYFKPLLEYDVIELKEEVGRNKYWGLTKKYLPLKRVMQSKKNLTKQFLSKSKQLELF